jgi:hypothetical protein
MPLAQSAELRAEFSRLLALHAGRVDEQDRRPGCYGPSCSRGDPSPVAPHAVDAPGPPQWACLMASPRAQAPALTGMLSFPVSMRTERHAPRIEHPPKLT